MGRPDRYTGRDRPRTDDTNWSPRDDLRWYADQVRGIGLMAKLPFTIPRDMIRELRKGGGPNDGGITPGDPVLAPIDGVSFDVWLEATAQIAHRRIPEQGRDAVAASLGAPAGAWASAEAAWRARQSRDPRLVERFSSNLVHRLGELQRENPSRA